jgi:L-fucose isomerase-like protein
MVSDKERLEEALRWLKEVKRLKEDKERLYSKNTTTWREYRRMKLTR